MGLFRRVFGFLRLRGRTPGQLRNEASKDKNRVVTILDGASSRIGRAVESNMQADRVEKENELRRLEVELQYLKDDLDIGVEEVVESTLLYERAKAAVAQAAKALEFDKSYVKNLEGRIGVAEKQLEEFKKFLTEYSA